MRKKKRINISWLWLCCLMAYILNIIIISLTGASLFNNIAAWINCAVLVICIIVSESNKNFTIDLYKTVILAQKEYTKMLEEELNEK